MTRTLLTLAAILAALAPLAAAQNPTVCVFQEKQKHTQDVDAVNLTKALTARQASEKLAFDYVPIGGFTSKQIEAEAQHRNCAWIVTLHREDAPPDTPNYAGTLGSSSVGGGAGYGATGGHVSGVSGQGGPVAGVSNSTIAANPAYQEAAQDGGMLVYDLRKADSKKNIAHGDATDLSTYDSIAAAIDKKLSKAK